MLYELRVREHQHDLRTCVLPWEDLISTVGRLRAEYGLGIDLQLFYKGRPVLTEQQVECFF